MNGERQFQTLFIQINILHFIHQLVLILYPAVYLLFIYANFIVRCSLYHKRACLIKPRKELMATSTSVSLLVPSSSPPIPAPPFPSECSWRNKITETCLVPKSFPSSLDAFPASKRIGISASASCLSSPVLFFAPYYRYMGQNRRRVVDISSHDNQRWYLTLGRISCSLSF